jgi:hypothetical protein
MDGADSVKLALSPQQAERLLKADIKTSKRKSPKEKPHAWFLGGLAALSSLPFS